MDQNKNPGGRDLNEEQNRPNPKANKEPVEGSRESVRSGPGNQPGQGSKPGQGTQTGQGERPGQGPGTRPGQGPGTKPGQGGNRALEDQEEVNREGVDDRSMGSEGGISNRGLDRDLEEQYQVPPRGKTKDEDLGNA